MKKLIIFTLLLLFNISNSYAWDEDFCTAFSEFTELDQISFQKAISKFRRNPPYYSGSGEIQEIWPRGPKSYEIWIYCESAPVWASVIIHSSVVRFKKGEMVNFRGQLLNVEKKFNDNTGKRYIWIVLQSKGVTSQ